MDICLIPCQFDLTANSLAELFFTHWYCENSLPEEIILDRDKLFLSVFWKDLMGLMKVRIKMSTAFHPQTDGSSEHTNKTLSQLLRNEVDVNQRGWLKALPCICFAMMNTVNGSTGFSGFQLWLGYSPRIIPPLVRESDTLIELLTDFLRRMTSNVADVQDNLLEAKVLQADQANKHCREGFPFTVGDCVMLLTRNQLKEVQGLMGSKVIQKLAPKFDGPFTITGVDNAHSMVTINIPSPANKCRTFHLSQVKCFIDPGIVDNKSSLLGKSAFGEPILIITRSGPKFIIKQML
jgi:hypothetical protein